MDKNGAITLAQEIIRLCKNYFNNVEPAKVVTVTKVYSNSADIKYSIVDDDENTQTLSDRKVPILKSCYGSDSLNLKAGDKVLLIYEGGSILNPYIIGKL